MSFDPPPSVLEFDVGDVMVKISQSGFVDVNNKKTGNMLSLELPIFEVSRSECALEGDWSNPDRTYNIKTRGDAKFGFSLKPYTPGTDEKLEALVPTLREDHIATFKKLDEISKEVHRQVFELNPSSYKKFIDKAIEQAKNTEVAVLEARGEGKKSLVQIQAMMDADPVLNARIMARASDNYTITNPNYGIPKMDDYDGTTLMSNQPSSYSGMPYAITLKMKRKVYVRVKNASGTFDVVDTSKLPSNDELPSSVSNWLRIQDKMSKYYKYNPFVYADAEGNPAKRPPVTDALTGTTFDSPAFTPFKKGYSTYVSPRILIDYSHGPDSYGCSVKPCNPITIQRQTLRPVVAGTQYAAGVSTFKASDLVSEYATDVDMAASTVKRNRNDDDDDDDDAQEAEKRAKLANLVDEEHQQQADDVPINVGVAAAGN